MMVRLIVKSISMPKWMVFVPNVTKLLLGDVLFSKISDTIHFTSNVVFAIQVLMNEDTRQRRKSLIVVIAMLSYSIKNCNT